MTRTLSERECDFCKQLIEEDEELVGIFVGEESGNRRVEIQDVAPKKDKPIGAYEKRDWDRRPHLNTDEFQVLGHPIDELQALLSAITNDDRFTLQTQRRVRKMEPVEDATLLQSTGSRSKQSITTRSYSEEIRDDLVSATLTVQPQQTRRDPTIEVCDNCVDAFTPEDYDQR